MTKCSEERLKPDAVEAALICYRVKGTIPAVRYVAKALAFVCKQALFADDAAVFQS